ncbi:hypothetical protein ACFL0V_04045 [Nanoarchaeota archaeon]
MISDISHVVHDPRFQGFANAVRQSIRNSPEEKILGNLFRVLYKSRDYIEEMNDVMAEEMVANDLVLRSTVARIQKKLIKGRAKSEYVIRATCPSCSTKERDQGKKGRVTTFTHRGEVDEPIEELDYLEGRAPAEFYPPHCGPCGEKQETISSANIILPTKRDALRLELQYRVKSGGRWLQKMTELLIDPDNAPSVGDLLGFHVIYDASWFRGPKRLEILKSLVKKRFGQILRPADLWVVEDDEAVRCTDINTRMQYGVSHAIRQYLGKNFTVAYDPAKDDKLSNLELRLDDDMNPAIYRAIHFYVDPLVGRKGYQRRKVEPVRRRVEGKVRGFADDKKANDPGSQLAHEYWFEKAERAREREWTPAHYALFRTLKDICKGTLK